ncbi:hypothetical protein BGX27_006893 [Mortierella sp. AM989]|nr:hypothetical protein BGX27_006893 [Mortierella sp. AM989]
MSIPLSGHSMDRVPGTTQLLVAGGESITNLTASPIMIYQTSNPNPSWTSLLLSPSNNVTTPAGSFHRLYHASITTGKSGMLLHGGYRTTSANGTVVSSLVTLKPSKNSDVIEPRVTEPVSLALNAPALARHSMTLTSDGRAIILGGINPQGLLSNLTMAYVMDTQASNATWTMIPLQGKAPDPRMEFTAVMVNATTLLLYGGTDDFKSAFWVTFYLDLPTWSWSSPKSHGIIPRRWGHTATMVGNIMVVAFGLTSRQKPDNTCVVLLDTKTNTWIPQFTPKSMTVTDPDNNNNDQNDGSKGGLSVGGVLGLAFIVTLAIIGVTFWLLVRRKKRKTRNTIARENLDQATPKSANRSRRVHFKMSAIFSACFGGLISKDNNKSRSRSGSWSKSESKRYSEFSLRSHQPTSVLEQMAQLGHPTPANLGYPDLVVLHGTKLTPISNYDYPNQACAHTEKARNGHETQIVFHDFTPSQKEAFGLVQEQERRRQLQEQPKSELLRISDDDDYR